MLFLKSYSRDKIILFFHENNFVIISFNSNFEENIKGKHILIVMQSTLFSFIFLVSGIFPGKADSVIMLGFECTINLQNLKSLEIFLRKLKKNFFFLCELGKTKKGSRYLQQDPRYRILMRLVNWFRLYVR